MQACVRSSNVHTTTIVSLGEISWVSIVHVPYLPKPTGNKATNNVHVHCSFVNIIFVDPLGRESGWPEGI